MDAVRWARAQELFHHAAALPAAARGAYLDGACGADRALADEVRALLDEDARGDLLLDRGLAAAVQGMVAQAAARPLHDIGAYRLGPVLGEGGMGVVYLAERPDLGTVAAVKLLRDAWLSPARRERFASEQRTLAQLNHPSIARLYDAGTLADGTPWIAMEYVAGEPLTAWVRARGSSLAERLRLFRAVCDAVLHAHHHAVIHRDLKPSNILVTADGAPKLLDFGIAKQLVETDAPDAATRTGQRLMTPAYAAPEQVRGERVGLHTDVYALGVILYELLAGRLPHDLAHRTPGEAASLVATQEPERPSLAARRAAEAGAPPLEPLPGRAAWGDLDVLCLTAMHKDPARRYRTVEALVRDVDHFRRGEPLEARPDGARYRAAKFVRRRWRGVAAVAAAAVTIASLTAYYAVHLAEARDVAVAEAARTQRIQRFMLGLFEGGDEAAGPSDSLRVVTLVQRGAQEAALLADEPEVQAELYATLGRLQQQLGDLPGADSLLRTALERRQALLGPDHADVAASLVALGLLHAERADFEAAERLVRDGLSRARRALPPSHPVVGEATGALGRVLYERGQYAPAVRVLEEAVRLREGDGRPTAELASSLTELASVHFYTGALDASDSLNRRVLALSRALHGERHPRVAEDLVNLGAIRFERGDYAGAERHYRDALAISEPWYGEAHHRPASQLTMLARSLVYQARHDEAEPLLRRALAIQERVLGPSHPRVASALNDLGNVAVQRGALDSAEARYRRMADIYRAAHGERHYLVAIALSNVANVHLERGDHRAAEAEFREVVARFAAAQGAEHLNTGIARIKLGRTLLRQSRWAAAAAESEAGYHVVARHTAPTVSWLHAARTDLAAAHAALGDAAGAARWREEVARYAPP